MEEKVGSYAMNTPTNILQYDSQTFKVWCVRLKGNKINFC